MNQSLSQAHMRDSDLSIDDQDRSVSEAEQELESETTRNKSTLISRNITVLGHRTSVRLEPEMWNALRDIAKRERCKMHDICSLIKMHKNKDASLTAAIRVFLMLYYRAAATEEGHKQAGHGNFQSMRRRADSREPASPKTGPAQSISKKITSSHDLETKNPQPKNQSSFRNNDIF